MTLLSGYCPFCRKHMTLTVTEGSTEYRPEPEKKPPVLPPIIPHKRARSKHEWITEEHKKTVLQLLAEGLSYGDVAQRMGVKYRRVINIVEAIRRDSK